MLRLDKLREVDVEAKTLLEEGLTERMLSMHFLVALRAPFSRRSLSPSPTGSLPTATASSGTSFSGRFSTASCAAPLCTFDRASSSLLCRARSTMTCMTTIVLRTQTLRRLCGGPTPEIMACKGKFINVPAELSGRLCSLLNRMTRTAEVVLRQALRVCWKS